MNNNETKVFEGEANWGRKAWLKLVDDKVIFDCSDEEYGPIEFDLQILIDKLNNHRINKNEENEA